MRLHGVVSFTLMLAFALANGDDAPPANSTTTTTTITDNATAEADLNFAEELEQLLGLPLMDDEADEDGVPDFEAQPPLALEEMLSQGLGQPDVFHPVSTQHKDVTRLVTKFMHVYQSEIDMTNLDAEVLHVLKAEKTEPRPELTEKSLGFLGIDLVEAEVTRQFRIFLLVNYRFKSAMFTAKRPYITTLRVRMDCMNTTTPDDEVELACDIVEHIDLPRVNESTAAVPSYIQREVARTAPSSLLKNENQSLASVHYDALESQDLVYDGVGLPVSGAETMEYVRFRVSDDAAQDCMIVVRHAEGISSLLYSDLVCYDGLNAASSTAMAALAYTKENFTELALIAAVCGALTAMLVLYRRRTRQRSGYSYLHSKNSSLSRLPSRAAKSSLSDNVVPAIAS